MTGGRGGAGGAACGRQPTILLIVRFLGQGLSGSALTNTGLVPCPQHTCTSASSGGAGTANLAEGMSLRSKVMAQPSCTDRFSVSRPVVVGGWAGQRSG